MAHAPTAITSLGDGTCGVRVQKCHAHVLGHRPGHDDAVGMTRRSHELDAKPTEVKNYGAEHVQICFATVAAAGAYLSQLQ